MSSLTARCDFLEERNATYISRYFAFMNGKLLCAPGAARSSKPILVSKMPLSDHECAVTEKSGR